MMHLSHGCLSPSPSRDPNENTGTVCTLRTDANLDFLRNKPVAINSGPACEYKLIHDSWWVPEELRRGELEKSLLSAAGATTEGKEHDDDEKEAEDEDRGYVGKQEEEKKKERKAVGILAEAQEEDEEKETACIVPNSQWQECGIRLRSLVALLKSCGKLKDLHRGRSIHADIVRLGLLQKDIFVSNALVSMYGICASPAKAQEVFDLLPVWDTVSWNTLITMYTQQGNGQEALNSFERMLLEGFSPNTVTFICTLKACGSIGAADKGRKIHYAIAGLELLEKDTRLGTALVDMYAKCGLLNEALGVFDQLPDRNVVSWSALIAGYVKHGNGEEALNCSKLMQLEGVSPDAVTFISILKACGSIRAANKGQEVHAQIVKEGLLEKDIVLGNTLIDMYFKCGLLQKAQKVFDQLPVQNVASWNVLIAGFVQHGHGHEALKGFERMQMEGFSPNAVTFVCSLKACGSIGAAGKGIEIHAVIAREGLLQKNIVLDTALVDMYARCGLLANAQEVFCQLPVRTVVSWSALITGYAQQGHGEEALNLFEKMQVEGLSPDAIAFTCILQACGSIGASMKGQEIHAAIAIQGLLEKDIALGNALVDMYSRCGLLAKAHEVFDQLPDCNLVLWSSLLAGYALLGQVEDVINMLGKMKRGGIQPDLVTFTILLSACSHTGLLDKSEMYFKSMNMEYCIVPTLEHYICMIDAFGRAGYLDKALAVIKEMPLSTSLTVWHCVLGACQKWENMKLARFAFDHAAQLDEIDAAAYVCIRNISAKAGGSRHEVLTTHLKDLGEALLVKARTPLTILPSATPANFVHFMGSPFG